eukprot:TRINITY_DN10800_c0_g1_i1.p1 TRINITY_DN10800_c0_g1~~TRINITY_DN10800_c0_g1_i1.p1  ORF type:complete len:283 (-),score=13.76 TRINITY_DN10800_c0_g1_i1:148-996(-)
MDHTDVKDTTDETKHRNLFGKVVLITGASAGLGREFALAFARKGCRIIVTARRKDLLNSLCNEINENFEASCSRAIPLQLDVSVSENEIDYVIENAWKYFGAIHVLVNNAGYRGTVKSSLRFDEEEWNTVMSTNLRGLWLVSKSVSKRMKDASIKGSVINISSTASLHRGNLPGSMIYAASKAGVNQLTKVMALELGPYGIRINAIAAGIFKSDITKGIFENEQTLKVAKKIVPAKRWGITNPDLTSLLLFLASDSSSYITGNIFIADGGATLPGLPLWSSL